MAAPKTVATYDLGSATEFDFSFDYLTRAFVQVSVIGITRQILTAGTDYRFVSNTRIALLNNFGPPEWTQIEIRRVTSTQERLVNFQDASILRADDLNLSDLQVLHVAEEAREAATETLGANNEGHLDARGRRIVNVADPIDLGDVLTLRYYQEDRTGTYVAKQAAEAARDKSKEWATSPNTVEGTLRSSKTYAEQASASATFSDQRATASANSATASANSATASANSANLSDMRAATSDQRAAASAASAALALEYAQKPVGTPVDTGGYSALHWASKAEEWAFQAGETPVAIGTLTSAVRQMYSQYIGVPIPWMTDVVPAGYIPLDGRAVPTDCPILLQRYPSGVVPDMRDYFIRGKPVTGRAILSLEADGNKSHVHSASAAWGGDHTHSVSGSTGSAGEHSHHAEAMTGAGGVVAASVAGWNNSNGTKIPTNVAGAHTHSVSGTAAAGGGHTHNVTVDSSGDSQSRPKNIAFMYICMTDAAIPELPTIGT